MYRVLGVLQQSFLLSLLLLLLLVSLASAQPFETSSRPSIDWKGRYYKLAEKVLKLEKAWSDRVISYETLKTSFQELELSHQTLQEFLTASEMENEKSIVLSETLQTRLDAISVELEVTKEIAVMAIRDARIQGLVIGGGIVAAAWVVVEVLKFIFAQ